MVISNYNHKQFFYDIWWKNLGRCCAEADVKITVKNSRLEMYVQCRGKPETLSVRKKYWWSGRNGSKYIFVDDWIKGMLGFLLFLSITFINNK